MDIGDVVLREWRESDLEALVALRNDFELQIQLMARPRPNSQDRVRAWLTARAGQEDTAFFVVANPDAPALGYIQATSIDPLNGCAELGICLSPDAHGRGIAQRACHQLESYLHSTFGVRKLTLQVLATNVRAIAFYRKSGYREVGILQRHHRIGDQFADVLIMERHFAP